MLGTLLADEVVLGNDGAIAHHLLLPRRSDCADHPPANSERTRDPNARLQHVASSPAVAFVL